MKNPQLHAATKEFAQGRPLPLVRYHFERGELDEAAAVARLALVMEDCPGADEIERMLDQCSAPPDDWKELLDRFAGDPSLERWRELMRFVPPDVFYQRHRNSIRYLRKRGVEAKVLFLCACHTGMTSDAIELVESGEVRVETILARAEDAGDARGAYVGLAAQAAFLERDIVGTIRLLREATALQTEWISVVPHIWFICQRATDAEHAALDRAGIPRP